LTSFFKAEISCFLLRASAYFSPDLAGVVLLASLLNYAFEFLPLPAGGGLRANKLFAFLVGL